MLITRAVWNIKPGGMIGRQTYWVSQSFRLGLNLPCSSVCWCVCAEVQFLGGGMLFADPLGGL